MNPDLGGVLKAIENSDIWNVAKETFYAVPFWIRAGLFVFLVVAAVVSKWILPAWANFVRARSGK